jgi:SAM-dependent methyltransferase
VSQKIDQDHSRFRKIVRGKIKQNLRKYISKGDLVGKQGKVYAVDIAETFVKHTEMSCHVRGWKHVEGIVCDQDDANLPPDSIDLAFICATYHHFEFPFKSLHSILDALKPGGQLVIVDFERIDGTSSDWILGHVRAGKETVRAEIEKSGFEFVEENKDLFKENYLLRFKKLPPGDSSSDSLSSGGEG